MSDDVARADIVLHVGDERPVSWELQEIDGDPLEATGFGAYATVRAWSGGPELHTFSTANTPPNARFTVTDSDPDDEDDAPRWFVELLVDDAREWAWTRGVFDLFITDATGEAQPIAAGTWINRPAQTRWSHG